MDGEPSVSLVRRDRRAIMEKLGSYYVQEELGRGGMGVVYRGVHADTGQEVALKVLPAQMALDPAFLTRFRREIHTLRQLDHPGIVHVYEDGEQTGALYYAMEFVKGRTLDGLIAAEGKLPPERAAEIILACARVLEYAHLMGVIHRDLKPANIMITDQGSVKLMDFGIAKLVDATRMTATQSVLGTVEYMSPEQSGGRFVDPRSDIYSLGVVFYQAVTAHLPISGTNATDILMKLRTRPVEQPLQWTPELPPRVNELIMKMLEKDPARRVPSAKALARELELALEQMRGKSDIIYQGFQRAEAPLRRNPWFWAAVALVLAAGAAIWLRPAPPTVEQRWKEAQAQAASVSGRDKRVALEAIEALLGEDLDPAVKEAAAALRGRLAEELRVGGNARRLFFSANVVYLRSRGSEESAPDARGLAAARGMFAGLIETYPETEYAQRAEKCVQEIDNLLQSDRRADSNAATAPAPRETPPAAGKSVSEE